MINQPFPPGTPAPGTWWQRHEALVLTVSAVVSVLVLTTIWWRVSGSKSPTEDTLLSDRDGQQANLAGLSPELRDTVIRTVREGRVRFATVAPELRPPDGRPAGARPSPAAFLPLAPVGIVVRELRPTLRWTPRPEATGYLVVLKTPDDPAATGPVSPELPATQTEWTPPGPLVAGTIYAWQVEARGGTNLLERTPPPAAPEARFQVLDEARRAELNEVERRFARFPLVMAVALARAGLADEATARLGDLAREHPQSAAAQRLQRGAEATRLRGRDLER